jgi:methyl-accepting chemotaxis protein/cation transport regulator ChaB
MKDYDEINKMPDNNASDYEEYEEEVNEIIEEYDDDFEPIVEYEDDNNEEQLCDEEAYDEDYDVDRDDKMARILEELDIIKYNLASGANIVSVPKNDDLDRSYDSNELTLMRDEMLKNTLQNSITYNNSIFNELSRVREDVTRNQTDARIQYELLQLRQELKNQNNNFAATPVAAPAIRHATDGANDPAMQAEIFKLREELSKMYNQNSINSEINKLKEELTKEKQNSEQQKIVMQEISNLRQEINRISDKKNDNNNADNNDSAKKDIERLKMQILKLQSGDIGLVKERVATLEGRSEQPSVNANNSSNLSAAKTPGFAASNQDSLYLAQLAETNKITQELNRLKEEFNKTVVSNESIVLTGKEIVGSISDLKVQITRLEELKAQLDAMTQDIKTAISETASGNSSRIIEEINKINDNKRVYNLVLAISEQIAYLSDRLAEAEQSVATERSAGNANQENDVLQSDGDAPRDDDSLAATAPINSQGVLSNAFNTVLLKELSDDIKDMSSKLDTISVERLASRLEEVSATVDNIASGALSDPAYKAAAADIDVGAISENINLLKDELISVSNDQMQTVARFIIDEITALKTVSNSDGTSDSGELSKSLGRIDNKDELYNILTQINNLREEAAAQQAQLLSVFTEQNTARASLSDFTTAIADDVALIKAELKRLTDTVSYDGDAEILSNIATLRSEMSSNVQINDAQVVASILQQVNALKGELENRLVPDTFVFMDSLKDLKKDIEQSYLNSKNELKSYVEAQIQLVRDELNDYAKQLPDDAYADVMTKKIEALKDSVVYGIYKDSVYAHDTAGQIGYLAEQLDYIGASSDSQPVIEAVSDQVTALRNDLVRRITSDATAFNAVSESLKALKHQIQEKTQNINDASGNSREILSGINTVREELRRTQAELTGNKSTDALSEQLKQLKNIISDRSKSNGLSELSAKLNDIKGMVASNTTKDISVQLKDLKQLVSNMIDAKSSKLKIDEKLILKEVAGIKAELSVGTVGKEESRLIINELNKLKNELHENIINKTSKDTRSETVNTNRIDITELKNELTSLAATIRSNQSGRISTTTKTVTNTAQIAKQVSSRRSITATSVSSPLSFDVPPTVNIGDAVPKPKQPALPKPPPQTESYPKLLRVSNRVAKVKTEIAASDEATLQRDSAERANEKNKPAGDDGSAKGQLPKQLAKEVAQKMVINELKQKLNEKDDLSEEKAATELAKRAVIKKLQKNGLDHRDDK